MAAQPSAPTAPLAVTAAFPAPAAAHSAAAADGGVVIPLTRQNLELIVDALASADPTKRIRALHYFGRAVDSPGSLAPPAPGTTLPPVPAAHAADSVWLSLLDRVVSSVVACAPLPPGTDVAAALAAASLHPPAGAPPASDPVSLSQTALSGLRKLFRNCAGYVGGKAGVILSALFAAMRGAPRELVIVLERTTEEICDRLPCDLALTVR